MDARESAKEIEDQAIAWVVRLDRYGRDTALLEELQEWLQGDSRREGAYIRAEAAFHSLDRLSIMAASESRDIQPPGLRGAIFLFRNLPGKITASIAMGVVAIIGLTLTLNHLNKPVQHSTSVGEIRWVPLPDGSTAVLSTDTRIETNISGQSREISLFRGDAWFLVAKDRQRPFIVSSGDVRVRAVGTAFAVRRHVGGADVRVTEGTVEVQSIAAADNVRQIIAGGQTFASDDTGPGKVIIEPADVQRSLAWRSGELVFNGETLEEAVSEFNRFNGRHLSIEGNDLAQRSIAGRFRVVEYEAFAQAASELLEARMVRLGEDIILIQQYEDQ